MAKVTFKAQELWFICHKCHEPDDIVKVETGAVNIDLERYEIGDIVFRYFDWIVNVIIEDERYREKIKKLLEENGYC